MLFSLFQPEEVEVLVCGGRELDFNALQGAAVYDDGYTVESQVRAHAQLPSVTGARSHLPLPMGPGRAAYARMTPA